MVDLKNYVESGEFFKSVVEDGSDIIFIVDYDGNIIYHNKAVEENLGYGTKSLVGTNFHDYIHVDHRPLFQKAFKTSTELPFDENVEFYFLCSDGRYRYFEFNSINILHKSGAKGLILDCRDITQRKKDAEELLRAQKAKEQFLANMSHEIRTPINGIAGLAGLMAESTDESERQSYLTAIQKSAESLKVIINDILDLSIIESGKLKFEKIGFSIKGQLETLYNTFIYQAKNKGLLLHFEIDPEADLIVIGDPVRLNQILINLISNALKFTHVGRIDMLVSLKKRENNQYHISFAVSDTGIGIPNEKIEGIFESFTQADESVTRRYGGTGLGLSISKQLVDLQGGTIKVKSVENKGSTFTFVIPYLLGSVDDLKDEKINQKNTQEYSFEDFKVLVVEDNDINRLYVSKLLNKWNIISDEAINGIEGIEKFSQNDYDLILMDLQMPVMDGFEATSLIRRKFSGKKGNIPIIALTANAVKADTEKSFKVGMNEYISKPFKPEELLKLLIRYYEQKKQGNNGNGIENHVTNLNYLREVCHGDEDFVRDMINVFLATIPNALQDIKKALSEKKVTEVGQTAHKIKPSISFMGLTTALHLIKDIELAGQNSTSVDINHLQQLFNDFEAISLKAMEELKNYLGELS